MSEINYHRKGLHQRSPTYFVEKKNKINSFRQQQFNTQKTSAARLQGSRENLCSKSHSEVQARTCLVRSSLSSCRIKLCPDLLSASLWSQQCCETPGRPLQSVIMLKGSQAALLTCKFYLNTALRRDPKQLQTFSMLW